MRVLRYRFNGTSNSDVLAEKWRRRSFEAVSTVQAHVPSMSVMTMVYCKEMGKCEGKTESVLVCEPPLSASSICTNSALSFEMYRLCVFVFHPGGGPVTAVFPPDVERSFRLLGLYIQIESVLDHQKVFDSGKEKRTYRALPNDNTCGQCLQALSKNGFVTPNNNPAFGCFSFTRIEWSLSWIVKKGRKSPTQGICVDPHNATISSCILE